MLLCRLFEIGNGGRIILVTTKTAQRAYAERNGCLNDSLFVRLEEIFVRLPIVLLYAKSQVVHISLAVACHRQNVFVYLIEEIPRFVVVGSDAVALDIFDSKRELSVLTTALGRLSKLAYCVLLQQNGVRPVLYCGRIVEYSLGLEF